MEIWIVEDEPLAASRLVRLLTPLGHTVRTFPDAETARAEAAGTLPDVVLLDIELPGESGLALARWFDTLPQPPAVVMVTAYPEHALAAFTAHAVDYLVKPVRAEALARALQAAARPRRPQAAAASDEPIWTFSLGRQRVQVPQSAIRYLSAEAKTVWAETTLGRLSTEGSLTQWAAQLGGTFVRTHRAYLVNRAWLAAWVPDASEGGGIVALRDGTTLPVSRRHAAAVRALFQQKSQA